MALGRRLSDTSDESVRIDLSPMIDCVFILLIFFIVTTVFVEESGIQANTPDVSNAPPPDTQIIPIELKIDDRGIVRYNGNDIGVQGVRGLVKQIITNKPDTPVIIEAGEKTPHSVFAEVYGEVRMTNAEKISFK